MNILSVEVEQTLPTFKELPNNCIFKFFGACSSFFKHFNQCYLLYEDYVGRRCFNKNNFVVPLSFLKDQECNIHNVVSTNVLKYGDIFILPQLKEEKASIFYSLENYKNNHNHGVKCSQFYNENDNSCVYYPRIVIIPKDSFVLLYKKKIDIINQTDEGPEILIRSNGDSRYSPLEN